MCRPRKSIFAVPPVRAKMSFEREWWRDGSELSVLGLNRSFCMLVSSGYTVDLAGRRFRRTSSSQRKKKWYIKKYADPYFVIFSSGYILLLASPEVIFVIAPSQHVLDYYIKDNPSISSQLFIWPAGFNIDYWKPLDPKSRKFNF